MNHQQPTQLSALSWRPLRLCEASPWDGGSIAFAFPQHYTSDDAAAMSEPTAAMSPVQRLPPVFPPANCDNSAAKRELPVVKCSGKLSLTAN
ncbi:MAG: hypothetical protein R3E39_29990 [Anaerolineae bacterium]